MLIKSFFFFVDLKDFTKKKTLCEVEKRWKQRGRKKVVNKFQKKRMKKKRNRNNDNNKKKKKKL